MVKFLHTADWQMGAKSKQLGSKASNARELRLQSVRNIVNVAKRENVDFILIAGDLFEDSNVDDSIVRSTVEIINDFEPIPTFVIPGNHDPFVPAGIWERTSWKGIGDHVHLLYEQKEVEFRQDLVLYPCPLKQKMGRGDPTEWIPQREEGDRRIRIGLAHGSLDFIKEPNFPIAVDRPERSGLDYLALGDWHGFFRKGKAVYSGTPEQTSYTEKNSGNVAIVTITGVGTDPVVEIKQVGILKWAEFKPSIQEASDVDAFEKEISSIKDYSNSVLKVRPQILSSIQKDVFDRLENIRRSLLNKCWYLDWPEDYESINIPTPRRLPSGMLSNLEDCLIKLSNGESLDPSIGDVQSNHDHLVAMEALRLLYKLSSEGLSDDN